MEKERMKEIVQEKYDFYVNEMHENLGSREERWNLYLKCSGMLDLAQELGCIDLVEYMELMDDLMKERANDKLQPMEEQLPFGEIPEENVLPFPPEENPFCTELEKIQELIADGEFYYMNSVDIDLLGTVHKELPDCRMVFSATGVYLVNDEGLNYLRIYLECELERAEDEVFDLRFALRNVSFHEDNYNKVLYDTGFRFDVYNGKLVKGDPEVYERLLESLEK